MPLPSSIEEAFSDLPEVMTNDKMRGLIEHFDCGVALLTGSRPCHARSSLNDAMMSKLDKCPTLSDPEKAEYVLDKGSFPGPWFPAGHFDKKKKKKKRLESSTDIHLT